MIKKVLILFIMFFACAKVGVSCDYQNEYTKDISLQKHCKYTNNLLYCNFINYNGQGCSGLCAQNNINFSKIYLGLKLNNYLQAIGNIKKDIFVFNVSAGGGIGNDVVFPDSSASYADGSAMEDVLSVFHFLFVANLKNLPIGFFINNILFSTAGEHDVVTVNKQKLSMIDVLDRMLDCKIVDFNGYKYVENNTQFFRKIKNGSLFFVLHGLIGNNNYYSARYIKCMAGCACAQKNIFTYFDGFKYLKSTLILCPDLNKVVQLRKVGTLLVLSFSDIKTNHEFLVESIVFIEGFKLEMFDAKFDFNILHDDGLGGVNFIYMTGYGSKHSDFGGKDVIDIHSFNNAYTLCCNVILPVSRMVSANLIADNKIPAFYVSKKSVFV